MANIYWNGPKASKKDTREALMKELVTITNNAFTVAFESDGAGPHVVAYVERNPESDESPFPGFLPEKFMGWRVLRISVPHGYIPLFYNLDGTKRVTQSSN